MEAFLGTILAWPISWAPYGWAFCWGQEININQNAALFSLLGTYYGGNGTTTFKLPDLRGRMIIGAGQRSGSSYIYDFARNGGNDTISITPAAMPAHNHVLAAELPVVINQVSVKQPVSTAAGTIASPQGAYPSSGRVADVQDIVNSYNPAATSGAFLAPATGTGTGIASLSGNTGSTGTGQSLYSMPPYTAMNYIIAMEGIYPSRS